MAKSSGPAARPERGLLAGLALLLAAAGPVAAQEAFPGAVGYGAGATGWRGGELIAVTTLEDSGPGSLRGCLEEVLRPRVCVFRVSGTIELDRPIFAGPDVYVAGQTAPGLGIQLKLREAKASTIIVKNTQDVVLRFLKLRPGPGAGEGNTVDALTLENASNVYLDHLSLMYAADENFNVHVSGAVAQDITLANSILALGLDRANHPDGRHSKGALVCSHEGQGFECGRITLWRNLFAHNRDRNPDLRTSGIGPIDAVNNLSYDPISEFAEIYNSAGDSRISYVGNVTLTGPSTVDVVPGAVQTRALVDGNLLELYEADTLAEVHPGCGARAPYPALDGPVEAYRVDEPHWPLSVDPVPASEVMELVLANAGDRLPGGGHLDGLDAQVLRDVRECTGAVVNLPQEAGGWPDIPPVAAEPDADGDLLPDAWEAARGLDPAAATDVWAVDPETGLSVVEAWLAELAGDLN